MSSAPTTISIAMDQSMDRSMGWSSQTSGGRGQKGYANQPLTRRQERKKQAEKAQLKQEKATQQANLASITELMRKAEAGELDWM
jgi:hypothetical protein